MSAHGIDGNGKVRLVHHHVLGADLKLVGLHRQRQAVGVGPVRRRYQLQAGDGAVGGDMAAIDRPAVGEAAIVRAVVGRAEDGHADRYTFDHHRKTLRPMGINALQVGGVDLDVERDGVILERRYVLGRRRGTIGFRCDGDGDGAGPGFGHAAIGVDDLRRHAQFHLAVPVFRRDDGEAAERQAAFVLEGCIRLFKRHSEVCERQGDRVRSIRCPRPRTDLQFGAFWQVACIKRDGFAVQFLGMIVIELRDGQRHLDASAVLRRVGASTTDTPMPLLPGVSVTGVTSMTGAGSTGSDAALQ